MTVPKETTYRLKKIIIGSIAILLNGLFCLINLSEWHVVKIQNKTSDYPFGGEGPTPYYYKSAELYSTVTLVWGLIFLILISFSTWSLVKKKLTVLSLALTLTFILIQIIHGQINWYEFKIHCQTFPYRFDSNGLLMKRSNIKIYYLLLYIILRYTKSYLPNL